MPNDDIGLLRPRETATRSASPLDAFWHVALDGEDAGMAKGWQHGFPGNAHAAVPGSINEQLIGAASHVGPVWYDTILEAPLIAERTRYLLRFDAAPLVAHVWLDGELLGTHEGGFLPFAFDLTDRFRTGAAHRLTVRVEHGLSLERTPVGGRPATSPFQGFPSTSFDFFPFGGLNRPVRLLRVPETALTDLAVATSLGTGTGTGSGTVSVTGRVVAGGDAVVLRLREAGVETTAQLDGGTFAATLDVASPRLWSPVDPHLQTLEIVVHEGGKVCDVYTQPVGIRSIAVAGTQILLNGEPVFLTGFGKHEDFPVFGRGLATPVIARDGELMRWVGANSYRTSHYPYAEEALDYADRAGFLVISETSAVGLNFYDQTEHVPARLDYVRAELAALIRRDRNHPSVIAWSVANEPFAKPIFQPGEATAEAVRLGTDFLATLIADAKSADPTRPAMVVGAQGHPDAYMDVGDILGVNRYYGWYTNAGRVADGAAVFGRELDHLASYGKPVVVTEFGTDTLPGCHAADAEMWTEEYQAEFIEAYLDEMAKRPHVVGAHVWNFADFKTTQSILRAGGLNHKGVFTRDRRPKLAAHLLRRRWVKP